jgi:DNA-binding response OmpR family regulator
MTNKILIGDDNQEVKEFLARTLKLRGLEVDLVSTPHETIAKAKENQYSVIITDLEYAPNGREGYDVLRAIKGLPATKILYTGLEGFEFVMEGILNGADAVILRKNQSHLLDTLQELEEGKRR